MSRVSFYPVRRNFPPVPGLTTHWRRRLPGNKNSIQKFENNKNSIPYRMVPMKPDALTLAVVVFVAGVLLSSSGLTEVFSSDQEEAPSALQQGVVTR